MNNFYAIFQLDVRIKGQTCNLLQDHEVSASKTKNNNFKNNVK